MRAIGAFSTGFLAFVVFLVLAGAADLIDFKVCISDAGRCTMTIQRGNK